MSTYIGDNVEKKIGVNLSNVTTMTDVVVVSLQDATPTSGALSIPFVTDVAAGSFKITLTNLSADTADVGASKINFCVIKGVAS